MKELEKEYCKYHGWEKKKGIMINTEMINTDYEKYFILEEEIDDFISFFVVRELNNREKIKKQLNTKETN